MARVDGRMVAVLAFSGLLWVGIGAATGHTPLPAQAASFFEKAQRYHVVHTLAALALCALPLPGKGWVMLLWGAGMVLFCGSLYAMALGDWALRYVVPFGGVAFMLGWLWLLVLGIRKIRD